MGWSDHLDDPGSYADYYPHLAPRRLSDSELNQLAEQRAEAEDAE